MAKPRSKVSRKVSGKALSKPTAEVQQALDIQAQKKRYDSWACEESLWEPESRCNATATTPCTVDCGNPSCSNYTVVYDPYYSAPPNSLFLKGIPMDGTGKPCEIDLNLPYLMAKQSTLDVEDVAPVAHAQAIVTFASYAAYDAARKARVVSFGSFLYIVRELPFVSKMLLDRLQSMEDYDQALELDDSEDDPLVGAALIPGLHRSEFTKPVTFLPQCFAVDSQQQQRLRKLLGKPARGQPSPSPSLKSTS